MLRVEIPPSTIVTAEFGVSSDKDIPKKKNRCVHCNKKLGLILFSCRCGGNFCAEHRLSDDHQCEYDFKEENKRKLSQDLVKVVGQKLDKL
jgi:predicted nucleic acid binding AN1-type Zn finger protein